MASSSSPSSQKRCLYDVLGLCKDCSPDDIRSAYKRLALQRHPDKLMKTGGLTESEATAQFQELVHAYEVLSDPKERAWYESHRSQILFSDRDSKSSGVSDLPDLFSFFSNSVYSGYSDPGRGFYKVYTDVFDKIFKNEVDFARTLGLRMDTIREAPLLGNLESPYAQVTAFYNHWLGFSTVMDFCWVDQYDAALGVNRKSRRVMEEENKKLRRKARKEFNETVRGLAEFVKKRDKRVIDMGLKRNAEMEKKKEEERERRKKIEKERLERAKHYEDPDWAKVEEEEGIDGFEDEDSDKKKDEKIELYCVVCSKKFKNEKQWRNHEQSKKHKEKVVELRKSFSDVESNEEEEEILGCEESSTNVDGVNEKFKEGLKIDDEEDEETEEHENGKKADQVSDGKEEFYDVDDEDKDETGGIEDDEMSMLKNMVFGHKNRRKNTSSTDRTEILKTDVQAEIESDEAEFPEYNNRKSKRRNRKDRREKAQKTGERVNMSDAEDTQNPDKFDKGNHNGQKEDSASDVFPEHKSGDDANGTEVLKNQVRFKNGNEEGGDMEHDNRKSTRKTRRAKKEKSKKISGGSMANVFDETKSPYKTTNMNDDRNMDESASGTFVGNGFVDQKSEPNQKVSHHFLIPASAKSTRSAKGKKAKASAVNSGNLCETCGEAFESRTKLHKHLGDSGHATLKFRR